jgi:hypothetical protein
MSAMHAVHLSKRYPMKFSLHRFNLLAALLLGMRCAAPMEASDEELKHIQQNGICFRLHDNAQRVAYMEKTYGTDAANKERSDIRRYNQYVVDLFKQHFNFCPVYYFYASQTSDLQARKPVLLNQNLETDSTIALPKDVILMAYNQRNIGESTLGSERFYVLGTNIEVRPNTFTTQRLKVINDTLVAQNAAFLPFRADKSQLLPTDVIRLNSMLAKW